MGVTWHLYGLILGVATLAAFWLIEKKAAQEQFPPDCVWQAGGLVLIFGLIGARLWHVWTDWPLYQGNLTAIWQIWQGGLSIFGAIVGGALGLKLATKLLPACRDRSFFTLADLAVFGFPLAQIIGRVANWLNGELYGLSTALPWKIFVSPENRLPEFMAEAYYHPLFAYEILLMTGFLIWIWRKSKAKDSLPIGSGFYFWAFLTYYSLVRFWLDFLRPDKAVLVGTNLGVNQVMMAAALVALLIVGWRSQYLRAQKYKVLAAATALVVLITTAIAAMPIFQLQPNTATLEIDHHQLQVEVVATPEKMALGLSGRDQIGSDGMLFIFAEKRPLSFWMKEMRFPLDMVWIADNQVIEITRNVPIPEPGTPLSQLPRYSPQKPADMVLEIPAGKAKELGIDSGSTVFLVK